jgi:hypothetical protein
MRLESPTAALLALTLAACSSAQGADSAPAVAPTGPVPIMTALGYPGGTSLGAAYSVAHFTGTGPIDGDAVLLLEHRPGKVMVWRELATGKAGPYCVLCHEVAGCTDAARVVSLQSSVACVDASGELYLGTPDTVAPTSCPYRAAWKGGAAPECLPGPAPYCGAGGHACLTTVHLTFSAPTPSSIRLVTPD